ncbi:MAG: YeeE/YedE thiosulfate transporter family protein [Thermoanaerobaculia bacterium]
MGSARKLSGLFYFTDFTVFKVMFSALVTAMLGLFWLARLGLVDPDALPVPDTFLMPQLVGGLVFGAGFVLAGLCPGTSCVAAATGRGDGLATLLGMFAGVLGFGLALSALPALGKFYVSGSRGTFLLPELLHLGPGAAVGLVVAIALTGFALIARVENRG